MDVGLNKTFKDRMRKQNKEFMFDLEEENPKPGWLDVAWWVEKSSNKLYEEMIKNAWKDIDITVMEGEM